MDYRRWFALFLTFALTVSFVEPVLGELRDGEIHHESDAAAALHAAQADGEHGHEDAGTPAHPHGGEHQHGTGTDHCTHQHGVAAPTTVGFALVPTTLIQHATHPQVRFRWTPSRLFQPPRA